MAEVNQWELITWFSLRNLSQEQQGGKSILVCQQQIETSLLTVPVHSVTLHPGTGAARGRKQHRAHKNSATSPVPFSGSFKIIKPPQRLEAQPGMDCPCGINPRGSSQPPTFPDSTHSTAFHGVNSACGPPQHTCQNSAAQPHSPAGNAPRVISVSG